MRERFLAYQSGKDVEAVRALSQGEEQVLNEAIARLRGHELAYQTFIHLCQEFEDLGDRCHKYLSEMANGSVLTTGTGHRFAVNQNRHILNLVALASSYLVHAKRRIKALFGDPSPQLDAFVALHRKKFADSFPYRFALKLRNYVQHYDLPMCRVLATSRAVPGVPPQVSCELALFFDRDSLLRGSFSWDALRADIAAQPDDWSAMHTLEAAMLEVEDLHRLAVSFEIDALKKAAAVVEALRTEVETVAGREACILDAAREGPGSETAHLTYPSWFFAQALMDRYADILPWSPA